LYDFAQTVAELLFEGEMGPLGEAKYTSPGDFASNGVLARLSSADQALLQKQLEPVGLPYRTPLESAFRRIPHVYFLQSGIASVVAISKHQRRQAEAGLTGFEGMTGLPIPLGTDRSPCNVMMQIAGHGLRIEADQLRTAMLKSPTLRDVLCRFVHVFAVQAEHTALSNALGTVAERLARWLLMVQDRMQSDRLPLTHDLIALMLGSRRAGVTVALGHFTAGGLITSGRGHITVLDRAGLETMADGLYGVPEAEYKRLFH
jgi:CRP-like cAMP-binding protein